MWGVSIRASILRAPLIKKMQFFLVVFVGMYIHTNVLALALALVGK